MKLITWNASMRFRDKIENLLPSTADLLVIPECEALKKWKANKHLQEINQFLWFGENLNKGIGILTFNDAFHIKLHPSYNKEFRYIIPLIVTGKQNFILIAVWSQLSKSKFYSYIGQIYLALKYYEALLKEPCIIAGDWNSNKIFDNIKRVGNHSIVVDILEKVSIRSAYHKSFNEEHGLETWPTHYFRKEKARPFHIDFIFASDSILKQMSKFEIGSYEDWIKYSDHMPIIMELNK
ncbi:endonuclease/exonuclease/phosphatase family protein [Bacillus sp. REN3]|uniref:endonuclease/exonuclease/phosphatase family protein n=1 Tax=Bacillus sp. REN3 TaxID=2802440 RepID=UPI001AEE61FC|nr:endonuclease/exonuclease/phosphatase family protein [Bacillus sp. REN3]